MHAAVQQQLDGCQLFIGCAAVADFRPAMVAGDKIKKQHADDRLQLELIANPDIIAAVAAARPRPYVVGFAAETTDLLGHAHSKLVRKKLDLIIANDVASPGQGFNSDNNAVTLLATDGQQESLPCMSKTLLAEQLISRILQRMPQPGASA